jgi:monoamine oxidase
MRTRDDDCLDVAIVGGGLCGLALATKLQHRGLHWQLFEARQRLGGRVLTDRSLGVAVDLGATWYWPAGNRSMWRLVNDLGLAVLPQPDDGSLLVLADTSSPPQRRVVDAASGRLTDSRDHPAVAGAVHGGALRLSGGMSGLIDALALRLPPESMSLGHVARSVTLAQADDRAPVEIGVRRMTDGQDLVVRARRVVFALPPRLVNGIGFEPPLPDELVAAQQATPTWMAAAAKAAVRCQRAVWRERGQPGNAWVLHEQGVWAESWDASAPAGAPGVSAEDSPVLAGFLAPPPSARTALERSWPLLLESQVQMLHGPEAGPGASVVHDWSLEPWTCSALDRFEDGSRQHPEAPERLRQADWQGRLWWAGSETSAHNPGYLEGALQAAARVARQLAEQDATASPSSPR